MEITSLPLGGFSFGQKTWYTQNHLGKDCKASYIELSFATELTVLSAFDGPEGGLTITAIDGLGYIHRFMHLLKIVNYGKIIAPFTVFAISGNSGKYTTGPHLHWDVRNPGTPLNSLDFKNFIDPDLWVKDILPNFNTPMIPQWFYDNGTDVWAKNKFIRIDQSDLTEADCKFLESLKKATQAADVTVNMFNHKITLTDKENDALKQAVRHTGLIYDNYVNLLFETPEKLTMELTGIHLGKIQGFTPKKGLNMIIVEDRLLDSLKDSNLNGLAFPSQNTILVQRSLLLKPDSRNRNNVNAMAGTLPHELSHIFGNKLDFTQSTRKDLTHDFDTNERKPFYTLNNYFPKLAWGLLHDKNFRTNNNI